MGGETGSPSVERVGADYLELRWAETDLLRLTSALSQFELDHGRLPAGDPIPQLSPRYLAPLPLVDPWGKAYRYSLAASPASVSSAGPDQRWETEDDLVRRVADSTTSPQEGRTPRPSSGRRRVAELPGKARPNAEVVRTTELMERKAEALRAFHLERGHYPVGDGVPALRAALVPEHLQAHEFDDEDAWATPWRYRSNDVGSSYTLVSAGSDKTFESLVPLRSGPVRSASRDLVIADGSFVRWAAGLVPEAAPTPSRPTATEPRREAKQAAASVPIGRRQPVEPGRTATTRARLLVINEAILKFRATEGRYPQSDDARRLMRVLSLSVAAEDAWGHRLAYLSFAGGSTFALVSPGADGVLDRSLEDYTKGAAPLGGRRGDIVVVNGKLLPTPG